MRESDAISGLLENKKGSVSTLYKPQFFRLNQSASRKDFIQLLDTAGVIVHDTIQEQIAELIKFRHPSVKFTPKALQDKVQEFIKNIPLEEYGVWVHYPWSNRLLHVLDEKEFIEIRTSRNQYKITPEERDELSGKKIGVIGLSVGQSVAVTLAMERICGELRLADFDLLELTNLNRIRTGLHNLGLAKVYSVAREIAEIDPFLNVICFPEGIHDENMEAFFCSGGKLDLMIEESDGFDIKILSRYKARELKIPVLMEASDRCMVDVERFDLEPERSILHGLVDHLDVATLKSLKTTEEKIPYMLDILGIDTASLRLKASMLEIEQTINTWPQLASAVTMGGGITADVARRILLNQFKGSGRYFIDVEELVGDKMPNASVLPELPVMLNTNVSEITKKLELKALPTPYILDKEKAACIVNAACLAPSGGNFQPWKWVYTSGRLLLFNAFDAQDTFLGADDLPSLIAFGAAIENLTLKASELGLQTHCTEFPKSDKEELIAIFEFSENTAIKTQLSNRISSIGLRLTNRNLGHREKIEDTILQNLQAIEKEIPGAGIRFFTEDKVLDEIAEVLGEVEKLRLLEEMGHRDFVNEIRWTAEENDEKKDGVDLRTLDITNAERVGLQVARDKGIIKLLNEWKGGGAFKKLTKKSIDSASAIGLISMPGSTKADYMNGGKILQKVWLDANASGIAFQPVSSSLFVYARLFNAQGEGISEEGKKALLGLRPRFERALDLKPGRKEIFIFRLCKAAEPKVKSLRKPLDEVLVCL
ncbi:MAG: Rv1355c family protein [Bacteroidia bacterium]|jgi:tRNA A37 threonylcarbamoyladenosine dehydratase|nr:Rv1355c family protein [Bacteroidia bacterium]